MELKRCLLTFRKFLLANLPPTFHAPVKNLPEPRLRKLMDLIKDKIRFPQKDVPTHAYFFITPEFEEGGQIFKKPFRKLPIEVRPDEVYQRIENEMKKIEEK